MASNSSTVVEAVARHIEARPDALCHRWLRTGDADGPQVEWSFAKLDAEARRVAAALRRVARPGDRALLVFPTGLEFGAALLACLRCGIVAVPAPPPNPRRPADGLARIGQIRGDCAPTVVVTIAAIDLSALDGLARIVVDELESPAEDVPVERPEPGTLALLQYTSGSTGRPKGVAITHANLVANVAVIETTTGPDAHGFCWGPNFHDLGLVIGFIVPWVGGSPSTLMDPMAFLQRPVRWLEGISRFRCNATAGPNFALDLVLARTSDAERAALDLSCLRLLGISAEPVRPRTVLAFAKRFAEVGLGPDVLAPGYGLAEATLLVTTGRVRIERFDPRALALGEAVRDSEGRALVSAGVALPGWTLAIVDPDSGRELPAGEIGELRISGPCVAAGYFGRSDPAFGPDGLRTGDLGFLCDGELFVVGRLEDVIIVRGQNHHPADIEAALLGCHRALRPGGAQVFGHDDGDSERVIVAAEIDPLALLDGGPAPIVAAVRAAVVNACGLEARDVLLVLPRSLPLTTSGKPQRSLTRARYLAGELARVTPVRIAEAVGRWLVETLAQILERPAAAIRLDSPLAEQGLDSVGVVSLAAAIERRFARACPPTLLYEAPTIAALVERLLGAELRNDATTPELPAPRPSVEPRASVDGVAIVGLACRAPGAADPEALAALLRTSQIAIGPVPSGRSPLAEALAAAGVPDRAGWLPEVDAWEPERFGVAAREASFIDPQHRLALELGVEALERAAIAPASLAGSKTGVFVGISTHDHLERLRGLGLAGQPWVGPGNAASGAANRISYTLDLRGPSMSVDTACSASLTAVHLACQSLRNRECELALAGGVNLVQTAGVGEVLQRAGMLAPDGRCKPFAAEADGYGRGEGGGMLVLRRLADALRDGDPVLAVIRGSALGQDGRSNGITAPNGAAQAQVIRDALAHAELSPSAIDYFETHGTGTSLGDPIEVTALVDVVGPEHRARLGAIKANLGHLEAAAGVLGLIKVVLALDAETMFAQPGLTELNPRLPASALELPRRPVPWPARRGRVRRAGVSAFGFTGALAHVVVEEPPERVDSPVTSSPTLVPLCARSSEALVGLAAALLEWIELRPRLDVADIALSLARGRDLGPARAVVLCSELAELAAGLLGIEAGALVGRGSAALEHAAREFLGGGPMPTPVSGRRVTLPPTPFVRRSFAPRPASAPDDPRTIVASLYDGLAEAAGPGALLTFGLLPEGVGDFAWLEAMAGGAGAELAREAQAALRRRATAHVDLGACRRVFDVGCGHGTDLIALAGRGLEAVGYTLSPAQADIAEAAVAAAGLADRVTIRCADSAEASLPGPFELALAYEVIHHVPDKRRLFARLAEAMPDGAHLIIADFVVAGRSALEHRETSSSFLEVDAWTRLFAEHGFAVDLVDDVSAEVGRYLLDPEFERRFAALPDSIGPTTRAALRSYDRLGEALRRGSVRYVLITARRDSAADREALARRAAHALAPAVVEPQPDRTPSPASADVPPWLHDVVARVLEIDEVPAGVPLADLGLDSIMVIELRTIFEQRLGRSLKDLPLTGAEDLAGLARVLAAMTRERTGASPTVVGRRGDALLITGATGFIGRRVLAALDPDLRPIYCLVRAPDPEAAQARLPATTRAVAVVGDLTQPRLGLSDADRRALLDDVGRVLHLGADIDFGAEADTLDAINVGGTRAALELARAAGAGFVHVSTLGVFGADVYDGRVVAEDAFAGDEGPLYNGYAHSKRLAEGLVREAAAEGVPTRILRPGFVAGDSRTGVGSPRDILAILLRIAATTGLLPPWDRCPTGLTPVDFVARAIAAYAEAPLVGRLAVHPLHSPCGHLPVGLIIDALRERGVVARVAEPTQWRAMLESLPDDHPAASMRAVLGAPHFLAWGRPVTFAGDITHAWLRARGIEAPPAEVLLPRILDWHRAVGTLAR